MSARPLRGLRPAQLAHDDDDDDDDNELCC
jgi:hypothetical protein